MNLSKKTLSLLALSGLLVVPALGGASCAGEDLNQYEPPDGLGGYDPSGGPPPLMGFSVNVPEPGLSGPRFTI